MPGRNIIKSSHVMSSHFLHVAIYSNTPRMQPLHDQPASETLPNITSCLFPPDPTAKYSINHADSPTSDTVVSLSAPKRASVTAEELLMLLDKINAEMAEEIARVTAAIGDVQDSVKLLRFDRMKACIRSAKSFTEDEGRNNLQFL